MTVRLTVSSRHNNRLVFILLSLLHGCTKAPDSAPVPQSLPVADAPTAVKLSSKSLQALDQQLADSIPRFTFFTDDRHSELIFLNIKSGELQVSPGLLIVRRGQYEFIGFDDEQFSQHGWIDGYISYDRKHIWAITDSIIESPSWDFNIVHSADGGATWVVAATIHKPYYLAGLRSFQIRPDGSGELRLLHEDNPENPISEVPAGYYIYTTKDWGNSWSAPIHLPDILRTPDEVPSRQRASTKTLSVYLKNSIRKTDADSHKPDSGSSTQE